MNTDALLNAARLIKEYCGNPDGGITNEESCPFFRGWKPSEDDPCILTVKCELNKGMCSPCNWDLGKE